MNRLLVPLMFISLNAAAQNGPYEGKEVPKQVAQLIDLMENSAPEAVEEAKFHFDKKKKEQEEPRPSLALPTMPFPTKK